MEPLSELSVLPEWKKDTFGPLEGHNNIHTIHESLTNGIHNLWHTLH